MFINCIRSFLVAGCLVLLAGSCTPVPQADDSNVAGYVQNRIGRRVHWNQKTHEDLQVQTCIELLLTQEITKESAIQIALLNNPEIQANFEELGIAQADLVQAGLFQNPIFSGLVRIPNSHSLSTNIEFSVTQSFLDVFLIPLRKQIAATEFEQTQLRVADMVVRLAFDVEETYYSLQAEQIKLDLLETLIEAKEIDFSLAESQYTAGNINELELQHFTNEYLLAKLNRTTCQAHIAALREKMHVLLGLRASYASFRISSKLPTLPQEIV
jgi:cobalt-zinc-cadmium efflux system outer membrane protein